MLPRAQVREGPGTGELSEKWICGQGRNYKLQLLRVTWKTRERVPAAAWGVISLGKDGKLKNSATREARIVDPGLSIQRLRKSQI